jgi:hypothetical protein
VLNLRLALLRVALNLRATLLQAALLLRVTLLQVALLLRVTLLQVVFLLRVIVSPKPLAAYKHDPKLIHLQLHKRALILGQYMPKTNSDYLVSVCT